MLRKLRSRLTYANVMSTLAVFFVLGGGTAVALDGSNTVFSDDIVNNEVNTADVRDDTQSFGGLFSQDLAAGSVKSSEIESGAVGSDEVVNNSLTGADINESSLNMPPTTTATFAGPSNEVWLDDAFIKIAGKNLPAGSYAIAATANMHVSFSGVRDAVCELRNGSGFIGGATDRRENPTNNSVKISLSMNGGAQVPAGGGEVSLWCRYQNARPDLFLASVSYGQMMIIRLDGFF